jgi:hypothetical protein
MNMKELPQISESRRSIGRYRRLTLSVRTTLSFNGRRA